MQRINEIGNITPAKYIKLPVMTYHHKEYDKFLKSQGHGEDSDDLDDIDIKVRRSSMGIFDDEDLNPPEGILVYQRYPVKAFKGMSYEPTCGIQTSKLDFSEKKFNVTMIYFKNGDMAQTDMNINDFEELMIEHGIIDSSIKDQYPNSTL